MDKAKLKTAFAAIEKQHGPGTVFRLGSSRRLKVQTLSTGCLPIDLVTGVGGFPRGRIIEVFGPPSGGKTTLCLHAIAQAQISGGAAAFVDAEHALDPSYAKRLGVDVDNLIVSQPDNGEQALEVVQTLIESGQFDIIVVDSVAALVPKAELEGEMGTPTMGLQARLMSQALRKLNAAVSRTSTVLVFINQIRMKIGVMYGNPETTTGGEALKFWASVRMTVRPGQAIKEGSAHIGVTTKIKAVKNKVAAPFKECEVQQIFGEGFDPIRNLVPAALELGILSKSGAHIVFGEQHLGNGVENTVDALRIDPNTVLAIDAACREAAFKPSSQITEIQEESNAAEGPATS